MWLDHLWLIQFSIKRYWHSQNMMNYQTGPTSTVMEKKPWQYGTFVSFWLHWLYVVQRAKWLNKYNSCMSDNMCQTNIIYLDNYYSMFFKPVTVAVSVVPEPIVKLCSELFLNMSYVCHIWGHTSFLLKYSSYLINLLARASEICNMHCQGWINLTPHRKEVYKACFVTGFVQLSRQKSVSLYSNCTKDIMCLQTFFPHFASPVIY